MTKTAMRSQRPATRAAERLGLRPRLVLGAPLALLLDQFVLADSSDLPINPGPALLLRVTWSRPFAWMSRGIGWQGRLIFLWLRFCCGLRWLPRERSSFL